MSGRASSGNISEHLEYVKNMIAGESVDLHTTQHVASAGHTFYSRIHEASTKTENMLG